MGLLKSTVIVSGFTLISRMLGLIRDIVFADLFGAGKVTDAFFVAFKIPNFMRRLFAEGSFSQAFVPVLSEYKTQRDPAAVEDLVRHVAGTLLLVLMGITLIAVLVSPILVMIFAPGFIGSKEKFDLTADMLRITFPYLLFISLTALAGSILNTFGRFAIPAITPVLLNLSLIGAAFWLAPHMDEPVVALAWGVFIAGVAQLAFQLPALAKLGLLRWPRWGWHHEGVRRIMRLMLPGILGSSVVQINLLLDTLIASFLVTGSVSWLYYSDRLVEFPLGIFGIALATVILPNLSEKHAQADPLAFTQTLDWALRWVLLIGTPAMIGLMLLAGPIISTIFQHGAFGEQEVSMASLSLMAYSLGLLGFIFIKILVPGYFSRQDTRTPVRISMIAVAVNLILNVVFVVPWVKLGFSGPHAGLALATSIAAFVNAYLLFQGLRRSGVYQAMPGWGRLAIQVLIANVGMGLLLYWFTPELIHWTAGSVWTRISWLFLSVLGGAGLYFLLLGMLGVRYKDFRKRERTDP